MADGHLDPHYSAKWHKREKDFQVYAPASPVPEHDGWNPAKVAAFSEAFYQFLTFLRINSKEKGGNYCLADGVYEAQHRLLNALFAGLAEDIHDFKVLKSRQLGISTISRALVIFWLGMHPGMQGAMIFDTDAHKEEAREEIEGMIDNLPQRVKFPKITRRNRYGLSLANGSRLRFMAAGVRTTRSSGVLGRSSGINLVHASEMCSWENKEGLIALKNALSKNYPDRLYLWESTARGFNDWYEMWEEAKKDDLNQRTVFIGWWAKDDQRLRRGSVKFQRYGDDALSEREAARIGTVRERYGFDVDLEQLAWYRELTDPNRELDDDAPEDSFVLQDQPWTEDEAFQQTGSTFFDGAKLSEHSARISTLKYQGFRFSPGTDFVTCDIFPSRTWREVDIKLWEEPQGDSRYVVAADPAYGHSERSNHSACQVLRCYADCVEQVAEFASTSTLTHQFAWLIWSLVGYYGSRPGNQVMTIIEINGPGEAVWREYNSVRAVVQNGYLRPKAKDKGLCDIFYNTRNYVYMRSDAMTSGHNLHWKTTEQLKVAIMERLRDFIHNGGILIRSLDTLEEMKAVARDGDKIGAEGDRRDDRTVALALGVRAWEEKLRRGLITQGITKEADRAKRSMSMVDQVNLFQKYQLNAFFAKKNAVRVAAQREARRLSWRR